VREDVRGIADICADIENVARTKEFGIALCEGPERIFVMAFVKERTRKESALDETEFENARFLREVLGAEDSVGDEFIAHGSRWRTGTSCGS
jgi:hypothetical protein